MTTLFSRPTTRTISSIVVGCLVLAQIAGVSTGAAAQASDDLKKIQYKYYFRGRYVEAVDALRTFLARTDLGENETVQAREFLAASYILSGSADLGRDQFLQILNGNESYGGPDPAVFRAEVLDVYASARDELAAARLRNPPEGDLTGTVSPLSEPESSKPIYKKWWFYAGLAAVVVVVGAATSKDEETEPGPAAPTGTVSVGVQVR